MANPSQPILNCVEGQDKIFDVQTAKFFCSVVTSALVKSKIRLGNLWKAKKDTGKFPQASLLGLGIKGQLMKGSITHRQQWCEFSLL